MGFDKEMQKALEADGDKLRQLTGEDHGPEFLDDECGTCGGEGIVFECFDGFCADADFGCEDCERPCPECVRLTKSVRDTVEIIE